MTGKTQFDLSITGGQDTTHSASVHSDNPADLVRLLVLSGQSADKTYSMNIASSDQVQNNNGTVIQNNSINVNTKNPEEIARILQLCGLNNGDDANQAEVCPTCGEEDCKCDGDVVEPIAYGSTDFVVQEQQAEYDYGDRDVDDDQETFDIKDYNFKGRADLPERLSSAKFGSNPLASEMKESIYKRILSAYGKYIKESSDIDGSAGVVSPLTANSRQEFDKDPSAGEETKDDGTESPLSNIKRQHIPR
jgi:hypothetical protein